MEQNERDKFIKFESHVWCQNIDFHSESDSFLLALEHAKKETDIQNYIKSNEEWFIPASLFEDYDFGHHEAYLIPEQALGAEYRVDYLLLGKNSTGYQVVLVEFEDVNVDFKLKNFNAETESVRKGLAQIRDWKRWMDDNRRYFFDSCSLSFIREGIPSWGIHYCLVVGRRSRMDDISREMRAQLERETPGLHIVSYDRLVDNIKLLTNGF